jgi:hypothetical protein
LHFCHLQATAPGDTHDKAKINFSGISPAVPQKLLALCFVAVEFPKLITFQVLSHCSALGNGAHGAILVKICAAIGVARGARS